MKLYLLIFLFTPVFLVAQDDNTDELKRLIFSNYAVAQLSDMTSTSTYNAVKAKAKVEGNVFLNEEWSDVEIFGNQGQSFVTKGKYNVHADELQFLDAKKNIKGISAGKIKGFMINGRVFLSKQDENLTANFYQILSFGKLELLIKHKTTLVTVNDNPLLGSANGDKKIALSEKLYYVDENGSVHKLPKGKKKILEIMKDKKTAMKKAIDEGSLNLRKKEDIIVAFDIYNSMSAEIEEVD